MAISPPEESIEPPLSGLRKGVEGSEAQTTGY